jgi:hypothetical protein
MTMMSKIRKKLANGKISLVRRQTLAIGGISSFFSPER